MERLDISKLSAQAKIAGTLVALGGAILSTLYKGIVVISAHRRHGNQTDGISKTWTIKKYPAPITLTSLSCLAGTLLAAIMTAILDHKPASWRLSWNITLLAPIYS
ncbi:hypothetical protein CICLE_v100134151mg, partial [Citrus x clementina]